MQERSSPLPCPYLLVYADQFIICLTPRTFGDSSASFRIQGYSVMRLPEASTILQNQDDALKTPRGILLAVAY